MQLYSRAMAVTAFGLFMGCTLKIGTTGGVGGADGAGGDWDWGGGPSEDGAAADTYPSEEETQQGEEAYAQLEQQELAVASARAGHYTCALASAIDTGILAQGLDPETLDVEALLALVEQYAPDAVEQAEAWLAGLDASTLPFVMKPKFECGSQGCAYTGTCQWPGYDPGVSHLCFVDDCGPARCSTCPDWVNNILQHVAHSTWCSYVCVQTGTTPPCGTRGQPARAPGALRRRTATS